MKSGSPSRTTAAHKTQTKIPGLVLSRLPLLSLLLLFLPKLLRGTRDGEWCRCRSLSFTPPASLRSHGSRPRPTRHIPPSPLAGRGVLPRQRSTPPLPPLLGGARQGGRGVPRGKDRRGERKGNGRMRSDRDEIGEREKKKKNLGPVPGHTAARSSTS